MRSGLFGFGITAIATVLVGCAGEAGDAEELVGSAEQEIAGGYEDTGDTAVVGIFNSVHGTVCSGSLIAPNLVLTARHCVSPIVNEVEGGGVMCGYSSFGPLDPASSLFVTTDAQMTQSSQFVGAYEVISVGTDELCGYDVALIVLHGGFDPNVVPPLTPRLDSSLGAGETYHAIGYGGTDDNGTGLGVRRRRDNLFVSCVGDACGAPDIKPSEWLGQEGVCGGDSGGPAIDASGQVVGVTSRGGASCTTPIYGHVMAFADWLRQGAVHAAQVGGYAAPAWAGGQAVPPGAEPPPVGDACTVGTDCASGLCVDEGDIAYCTLSCAAAADCPSGYYCDAGQSNVCLWDREVEAAEADDDDDDDDDDAPAGCQLAARRANHTSLPWLALLALPLALGRRRARRAV